MSGWGEQDQAEIWKWGREVLRVKKQEAGGRRQAFGSCPSGHCSAWSSAEAGLVGNRPARQQVALILNGDR